jgi:hypothetical protein
MPNVFLDDYSQFPNDLTEKLSDLKKAASYKLLLVILQRVQQYGNMRVKISSKEAKLASALLRIDPGLLSKSDPPVR